MVSAVRQRSTPLPASASDNSPVPSKRAKYSHRTEPEAAVKSLLGGGTIAAQNHDRSWKKSRSQFDESRAVVSNGLSNGDVNIGNADSAVVEISSDADSEEEEEDDEELEQGEQETLAGEHVTGRPLKALPNGVKEPSKLPGVQGSKITEVEEGAEAQGSEDDDDDEAPTFGELIARDDAIDVEDDDEPTALVPAPTQSLAAPNALTLTSVLTQALRTNDRQMLESCLLLNDLESIRKTIERLPSPLVATLLKKLSERLHRRPGRAGNLLVWVQWSLVAHGGYLASQPDVVRRLQDLNRVIKERAAALQPLMGLKGRLDMLAAQVDLRRSAQARAQAGRRSGEEDAVIYVEGEESSSSDDDDDDDDDDSAFDDSLAKRITGRDNLNIGEAESSGDEIMLPNGIAGSDDDGASEDEEDDDRLIDDEAEETDEDEDDDEEESEDAFDDDDDDGEGAGGASDEEDDRPATRRSTALRGSGFARR